MDKNGIKVNLIITIKDDKVLAII